MDEECGTGPVAPVPCRRLCLYSLSHLRQVQIRRILSLAGYRPSTGWPGPEDVVGVWGQKPAATRGRWVARQSGAPLVTIEDGFLRSVYPGVTGAPPLSLILDDLGIYYDATRPSRLEHLIEEEADAAMLARAASGITALRTARLSKYTPPVPRQSCRTGRCSGHRSDAGRRIHRWRRR